MLFIICSLLTLGLLAVLARVLLSWFPMNPQGTMATIAGFLYTVTDPVLKPLRQALPAARFGGVAIDFSPVIVVLAIVVLRGILC